MNRWQKSGLQEFIHINTSLLEDGKQRPLGHVSGVVRQGGIAICRRVVPNLMRTRRLTVKLKAEVLESLDDNPLPEAAEPAHQRLTMRG